MKPYNSINPLVFPPLFRLSHDGDTYEQRGPGSPAPQSAAAEEGRSVAGYWLGFFFVALILVAKLAAMGGVH